MKRIIMSLIATMLLTSLAQGSVRTEVERDANGNKKRIIELRDTVINGKSITDTLSIMTFHESLSDSEYAADFTEPEKEVKFNFDWKAEDFSETIVSIIAIIFVFGMPVFIVLIVLHYRSKNRQAKYRLAEKAIAAGQPLPAEFFQQMKVESTLNKGIKNIFLGIGLAIFLYALTDEVGFACIGILTMFTGFGQVVIHYANQKRENKKDELQ